MGTPKNSVWTEDTIEAASKLWKSGKTAKQVAEALGPMFNKNMVISLANRARERFPARKPLMETALNLPVDAIAKIWNETNRTSSDIGKEFGAMASTIRGLVTKNPDKFNPRPRGGNRPIAKARKKRQPLTANWDWKPRDKELPKIVYRNPDLDEYELARLPYAVDLNSNTGCKYPLTDTGPHLFCSAPKMELKPYCAYHAVKCAGPGTMSERRAHKA